MLYAGVFLVSGLWGALWTLFPAVVADSFGMHAFAAIYNLVSVCSGAASYLCSVVLASAVYEAAIPPGGGVNCVGGGCYRGTFLALGGMCGAVGGAAAWALYRAPEARAAGAAAKAAAVAAGGAGAGAGAGAGV